MGRFQRADYRWLLLADPPVCRAGRPEAVLNNCDRLRRSEQCWCRFETEEIVEDVALAGAAGAADDWLTSGDLDARDVEELRDTIAGVISRSAPEPGHGAAEDAAEARERLRLLTGRLTRLVNHGSGLSDRHADDVD